MIEKTCRCGKTKKNFVIDIGPFFIEECCIEAGYDHLGNKKIAAEDVGLTPQEVENITPEAVQDLEIIDEGELPDPNELEETAEQEKAKKKAEKEAKKAAKKAEQAKS